MNIKDFILGYLIGKQDGGGGASVEPLTVTENGEYSEEGVAYSPVTVNVSGGGGLEYEEGTWTPTENSAQPTISFANQHTTAPFYVALIDATGDNDATLYTNCIWELLDFYQLTGKTIPSNSPHNGYGIVASAYRTNSVSSLGGSRAVLNSISGNDWMSVSKYVQPTGFVPNTDISGGTQRMWRTGRTYKWIAIWK